MATEEPGICWDSGQEAYFKGWPEMEEFLNQLEMKYSDENPIIAIVSGPGGKSVYFRIGGKESFVSSCDEPYLTSVGNPEAKGEKNYSFHSHHSPVLQRNLISAEVARRILREFFMTGKLPTWQNWEPI